MPQSKDNVSKQLYDMLSGKGFSIKSLNATGSQDAKVSDADIFAFDFKHNGTTYGEVVLLLGDDLSLEVLTTDALGKHMDNNEGEKDAWFNLLEELRNFSRRKLSGFKISDASQMPYRFKKAEDKASLAESAYWGSKHISRTKGPQKTRIRIKHSRALEEGEARFRNIQEIYIETADDQRFKLQSRSLQEARAQAQNCAVGGNPWDQRGRHISQLTRECAVMGNFLRRVNAGTWPNSPGENLVEAAKTHLAEKRKKLKKLGGRRGYASYFSTFEPGEADLAESTVRKIKELFQATDTLQLEEVAPVLAGMKEADEFERWADSLLEGTWALPTDKDKEEELIKLMSKPLKVGAEAQNATGALYDLIGDDELFDMLHSVAENEPEADARPTILRWMEHQGANHEVIGKLLQKLENTKQIKTDVAGVAAPEIKNKVQEPKPQQDPVDVMKNLSGITQQQVPPNRVNPKP